MLSNFTASAFLAGSLSYTPSMFLASRITSAPISAARSTAAVSVEKNGQPMPQPKMTTRPFSRCRMALARMYGSATARISSAVCTRTSTPFCSSTSAMAMQFIAVASMPMWSARVRSI